MRGTVQVFAFFALVALLACQLPGRLLFFRPSPRRPSVPGAEFVELSAARYAAELAKVQMPWQAQARLRLVGVPDAEDSAADAALADALPAPDFMPLPRGFFRRAVSAHTPHAAARLCPPTFAAPLPEALPQEAEPSAKPPAPRLPRAELLDVSLYESITDERNK